MKIRTVYTNVGILEDVLERLEKTPGSLCTTG